MICQNPRKKTKIEQQLKVEDYSYIIIRGSVKWKHDWKIEFNRFDGYLFTKWVSKIKLHDL